MTRIYKSVFAALIPGLVLAAGAARADERILEFEDVVTVQHDGTLEVRETIRVRAEGENIRRGIYRDFPTIYPVGDHQVVVGFKFEAARRDGNTEDWHTEQLGNGVRVYLGNKDVMLPHGEHTYVLSYRTDHQLGFFSDHDELYWNATGNGWGFPIDHATARIVLPPAIPRGEIKLEGYTGPQGSKLTNYTARLDGETPWYETTRALEAHEGLTIVAMWPKGFIEPSAQITEPLSQAANFAGQSVPPNAAPLEKLFKRRLAHNNVPSFFGFGGLLLLLFYYYRMWVKVGRDPPGRIAIPEYEPPPGQSPASMRYVTQMSYDNNCFGAAVLSLAVKGYLRIDQSSGVLGLGKTFSLIREPNPGKAPLSEDEKQLLAYLFSDGDTLVLKQENHERVSSSRTAHRTVLKDRFTSGFFAINGGWHALGIGLSVLLAIPALLLPGRSDTWPLWHLTTPSGWFTIGTVVAMFVVNGVFGRLLRAPTVAGQAAMDHIRGFKMYLEVAEGEELKRMKSPPPPLTPQLFESYLPAALALGVEQRWAERFANVLNVQAPNYSPTWYSGPGWNIGNMGSFSHDLGSSLNTAISSSAQAPGSSSGGGGGGSSGGGGGGGGGGGW